MGGAATYLDKFNKQREKSLGAKNVGNLIIEKSNKLDLEQIQKVFTSGNTPKL